MNEICKGLLRSCIYLYRWVLSPAKVAIFGPQARCRFEPCCSSYALQALDTLPLSKSLWLILKRIGKCHPWGESGADPVPKG